MKPMIRFFLITLIGLLFTVQACKPGETSQPEPPAVEPEITGRLMTDAELVNREDPLAPGVRNEWRDWIKVNVDLLRSLTYDGDFSDLQFLKPLLEGRSVIQLGESGHGVREFNRVKVRLIKFLHQQMEFDVIAFESSIFNCYQADTTNNTSAEAKMKAAIYQVWHTDALVELFQYIIESRQTANPLILAGFDMKSSALGTANRPQFLKQVISSIDPAYAQEVYDYDLNVYKHSYTLSQDAAKKFYAENRSELKVFYQTLLNFIDDNMEALLNANADDPVKVHIARQTVYSKWVFVDFKNEINQDNNLATLYRDEAMAENVAYLKEHIYPGKKIMMWAHNFHIRHRQEEITGTRTMGHWLEERFRPILYTIGLYMYRGKAAWNTREIYNVTGTKDDSLEAIGYHSRLKYFFVDMLMQQESSGNSWMRMPIENKGWGTSPMQSVLKDQYDGILFIDTVNPPQYR